MSSVLGWVLCVTGGLLLLVAAVGLLRLPDALARQHAATKAGTVAVTLVAAGAAVLAADWGWSLRLLMIIALLLVTLPLASHALSRAAAGAAD